MLKAVLPSDAGGVAQVLICRAVAGVLVAVIDALGLFARSGRDDAAFVIFARVGYDLHLHSLSVARRCGARVSLLLSTTCALHFVFYSLYPSLL